MQKHITTKELSELTGYSMSRIRQIAKKIPGSRNESGRGWIFRSPEKAVAFMKGLKSK